MDYFHESERHREREQARHEKQRLEFELADKDREIRRLEERVSGRDQSLREKDELIADKDRELDAIRRALNVTPGEDSYPTGGIARNRTELIETLLATIREATGFLSGLGYEGDLVRAVVALADRATELKHERDAALRRLGEAP